MKKFRTVFVLSSFIILSACGGGGSEPSTTEPVVGSTPSPVPNVGSEPGSISTPGPVLDPATTPRPGQTPGPIGGPGPIVGQSPLPNPTPGIISTPDLPPALIPNPGLLPGTPPLPLPTPDPELDPQPLPDPAPSPDPDPINDPDPTLDPTNTLSISGSVTGLFNTEVVLSLNQDEEVTISSDGDFSFNSAIANGSSYEVLISKQPQAQSCSIDRASGQATTNVELSIVCKDKEYDIIYVRYPNESDYDEFVDIPQGENAYDITAGADLMLLRPDGTETVLVDCSDCSVMDPFISFDGKTVYYSLIVDIPSGSSANQGDKRATASWIYKINLDRGDFTPIRLTFNDGFDSSLYAGNNTDAHDQASTRGIRDMAPAPLADGRIVFTSNRSALTTFRPGPNAVVTGSVQQLYVIDDHDGTANTSELSNLTLLDTGNLHLVQHPFQLKDGRILFSTWQSVAQKFRYAMTSLFTIYPDGTNLSQFTEPHDHSKMLDHFATELPDNSVVSGYYYPSFDYGYGILNKYPIDYDEGPDFLRGSIEQRHTHTHQPPISRREFDRKGFYSITPHTTGGDQPAPNLSGKYSMPSATVRGGLLVAYSTGSVNHFHAACAKGGLDVCEALRSGIYLIEDATTNIITDPAALIKIKDDPNHNEMWPRVVATYYDKYGQEKPDYIGYKPLDASLDVGQAAGLVGAASMIHREPLNEKDKFRNDDKREFNNGNWRIEGAEAGIFDNEDITGVRIIATPSIPFTKPLSKYSHKEDWDSIERHLEDNRLGLVVARFGSLISERWEILGEFPLTHKDTTDDMGDPDTSWLAKVPADTPFLIQTLDKNGMTIVSELTWRSVKSGETLTCGGCHTHSIEPLDFEATQAGKRAPISGLANISISDPAIQDGIWDLTKGSIPLFTENGVELTNQNSVGVEFTRDILPIINRSCVSCHTPDGTGSSLVLNGSGPLNDAYAALTNGDGYRIPQMSKYIRTPQARESLLTWIVWGERLDGRSNEDRDDDVDYPAAHPALSLTDLEKRTFARWIDLGSPIDFPELSMQGQEGFRYTDDYQLPVINIHQPQRGETDDNRAIIGFADAMSGINWNSLTISYYPAGQPSEEKRITSFTRLDTKVVTFDLPTLSANKSYILKAQVTDNAGNRQVATVNFMLNQ